jgi:hypothetical protein
MNVDSTQLIQLEKALKMGTSLVGNLHSKSLMKIEAVMANFVEVAKDPHGSFVLQECLIHCDGDFICEAASAHWVEVANDKYGSHTLGKWLSLCDDQQMNRFLDKLKGGYVDLSMHEFGSRVAEKCLECAGDEQLTRLIKKRLIVNPWLDQIMQDRYGNYVIKSH